MATPTCPDDLSEVRLNQIEAYADSYRTGGVGEKMLAERIKLLTQEIRRLRKKEAQNAKL